MQAAPCWWLDSRCTREGRNGQDSQASADNGSEYNIRSSSDSLTWVWLCSRGYTMSAYHYDLRWLTSDEDCAVTNFSSSCAGKCRASDIRGSRRLLDHTLWWVQGNFVVRTSITLRLQDDIIGPRESLDWAIWRRAFAARACDLQSILLQRTGFLLRRHAF